MNLNQKYSSVKKECKIDDKNNVGEFFEKDGRLSKKDKDIIYRGIKFAS